MEIASKKRKLLQHFPTRHDEARLFSLEQKYFMQRFWISSVGEGRWSVMDFFSFLPCISKHRMNFLKLCVSFVSIYIYICWSEQMTTDFALTTGLHSLKSQQNFFRKDSSQGWQKDHDCLSASALICMLCRQVRSFSK